MPHPASVYGLRLFAPTDHERHAASAYADGLETGATALAQGHGSDPYRVRTETDLLTGIIGVYLQMGTYADDGQEVYR